MDEVSTMRGAFVLLLADALLAFGQLEKTVVLRLESVEAPLEVRDMAAA